MFCHGNFKYPFIGTLTLQAAMQLVWGRRELTKDTELSRRTSSRAGRQPILTKEAQPEESYEELRDFSLYFCLSFSLHLWTMVLFFSILTFSATCSKSCKMSTLCHVSFSFVFCCCYCFSWWNVCFLFCVFLPLLLFFLSRSIQRSS